MKVGSTRNGHVDSTAEFEVDFGFENILSRMDGKRLFAYCLWHYPDNVDFDDVNTTNITNYLQTAGNAERLTIELRETNPDGTHTHYILARTPITTTHPTETITWDNNNYHTHIHPEEVFTAHQAAPLFHHYAHTQHIPHTTPRRKINP